MMLESMTKLVYNFTYQWEKISFNLLLWVQVGGAIWVSFPKSLRLFSAEMK